MGFNSGFKGLILPTALGPNKNEYQGYLLGGKGGRCVGMTTLPPSCAKCVEILRASNSWSFQGLSRPVQRFLYLYCVQWWPSL